MKVLRIILIAMVISLFIPLAIIPADTAKAATYADVTVTFTPKCYGATPIFTTNNASSVTYNSARLNGTVSNLTCADASDIFWEWGLSTGNYTANYTDTTDYGNGSVYYDLTSLNASTTYYYRGAARLDGESWQYGSEISFTTPAAPTIIEPPDPFTVEQNGVNSGNITWTQGANSNTVMIRASLTGYPSSVTDGWLVYSGNASQYTHEGLSLETSTIYYSSWGEAGGEYSSTYSTAKLGGTAMLMLTLGIITIGMSYISSKYRHMLLNLGTAVLWAVFLTYITANYTPASDSWMSLAVVAVITFILAYAIIATMSGRLSGSKKFIGTDSAEAFEQATQKKNSNKLGMMGLTPEEYKAYLLSRRQRRK